MSNTSNGDLGQTVLNALIKIAEKSKHVKVVNFNELSCLLDLNKLVLIVAIKKLQKHDFIEAIFDGDKLYFKLTGLAYEVAA